MAEHNELGKLGEQKAVHFLREKGYKIINVNWQERKFELDIIAKDNNQLVFVEVKTRATDFFGNPEEAVNLQKQKHLIDGADFYIQQNNIDLECRFDVIAIVMNEQKTEIKHIKEAFLPEF